MSKKNVYPSKIKYDKSHPVISIRVDQALKEELEILRNKGHKSVGDIVREALGKQKASTEKAYKEGFESAKDLFRIKYHCAKCGGAIILNTFDQRQSAAQYMRDHGWSHLDCNNK